jgi:hypothetical protein
VQEAYRTPNQQDWKRNNPRHIIIKTEQNQHRTKKEFWKLQKRKDKSHIQANLLE